MTYTTLIDAATLCAHLDDPDWVVIDCRFSLADTEAGRRAYGESHLPGARYAHLDEDLSGPITPTTGRHPLPDPALLAPKLSAWGLGDGTQVVAYDDAAGAMAARVWWLLRAMGFERVAVLDGGLGAWCKAGFELNAEIPAPNTNTGTFTRKTSLNHTVTANDIAAQLPVATLTLVDARAPERYRGEVEPLDPVAGHIPTAHNQFMMNNIDEHGHFKPAELLRAQWMELLGDTPINTVVNYCGSGVTACHNLLSMHIAGLDISTTGAAIYPGSWSEWCADTHRPMAKHS